MNRSFDKNGSPCFFKNKSYDDYFSSGVSNDWNCNKCKANVDCNVRPMAKHLLKHGWKVRFKGHYENEY